MSSFVVLKQGWEGVHLAKKYFGGDGLKVGTRTIRKAIFINCEKNNRKGHLCKVYKEKQ